MSTGNAVAEPRSALDEGTTALLLPGQSPEGEYILGVLFKRTYDVVDGESCRRAEKDVSLIAGDVHYDGPVNSSVRYESDFIPWKNGTDVVFNGKAYAPGGHQVYQLTASLSVGDFVKNVQVTGDRSCRFRTLRDPEFTDPVPFVDMDMRYERAYGGTDIYSHPAMQYPYPRNHLGTGFVVKNKRQSIDGLALPNIEDPEDVLIPANICCGDMKYWNDQPMPQGFGWFAKYWQPRAGFAGVMPADRDIEQEMRRVYAQIIPESQRELYEKTVLPDMDFRFFSGASAGLSLPYLTGDETIRLINLSAEGACTFMLPGEHPSLGVDIGLGLQEPQLFIHTVQIRMEERQVDMVWRGAISYPGPDWLPEMKKKEITIQ